MSGNLPTVNTTVTEAAPPTNMFQAPISFEGLPDKFSGLLGANSVSIWCRNFLRISKLKGWSEETSVVVFKTWIQGNAAEWLYSVEIGTPESEQWNIVKWTQELETRFPQLNHEYEFKKSTTRQLAELKPTKDEPIKSLNLRFLALLNEIPASLYTAGSIRVIYLESLVKIDRDIAWSIIDTVNIEEMDVKSVMKAVEQKDQLKRSFRYVSKEDSTPQSKADSKDAQTADKKTKTDIEIERFSRSSPNVKCFNCGESGHTVRECKKPLNKALQEKLAKEFKNASKNSTSVAKSAMFAYEVTNSPLDDERIALSASKRIRIDDLLDNNFGTVPRAIPRTGISEEIRPPASKNNKKKNKSVTNSTLPGRILDMNFPITIKEFLLIKHKAVDDLISTLRHVKKSKPKKNILLANESDSSSDESDGYSELINSRKDKTPLCSYVLIKIGHYKVPLIVDTGASCCIISLNFLKALNIKYVSNEVIETIKPVDGPPLEIKGRVVLTICFAEDVNLAIEFQVLGSCAVPILLGRDVCHSLKSKVNYEEETFSFNYKRRLIRLQLFSKSALSSHICAEFIVENDAEDDTEYSDSDGDESGLYLEVMKSDITGSGSPPGEVFQTKFNVKKAITDNGFNISSKHKDDFEEDLELIEINPSEINYKDHIKLLCENLNEVSDTTKESLKSLLLKHRDVFPDTNLGISGITDFEYKLTIPENTTPVLKRLRRYSDREKTTLREHIEEMLNFVIISKSNSEWCFPVVLVPKSSGELRFCVNFKQLNDITKKDHFPLPRIDDCLEALGHKVFFSTLDCFPGYWQVKLHPQTQEYCSFITPMGVFKFNRLPFGLTNAPAFFQSMMERIFAEFLYDFLIIYLDDLCVGSETEEDHLKHLERVLEVCKKWNVKLKLQKCSFFEKDFRYLGYFVTKDGLLPDPLKTSALLNRASPRNVKEARSFLCLCSYFRKFLDHYAEIAEPIQALIKKNAYWEWTAECESSFCTIKKMLIESPVLQQPDPDKTFILSTDASSIAIGA
ncbi:Retrovirus-related Pol polyprotein from transposon, partial [Smittium culicis]